MPATTSDDRFTQALRELAAVQEELAATAADQFSRRQELSALESELRLELRSFRDSWTDHLSIDQLQLRIADVTRRISDHYGNRLSHISGAQSGLGGGLDPTVLHRMHRAMDDAADLPALQAELARLKDRLAKLRGE
jgi:hypothetical protein